MPPRKWNSRRQLAKAFVDYVGSGGSMVPNQWDDERGRELRNGLYQGLKKGERLFRGYRQLLAEARKHLKSIGDSERAEEFHWDKVPRERYRQPRSWTKDVVDYTTQWLYESCCEPEKSLRTRNIDNIFRAFRAAAEREYGSVGKAIEAIGLDPENFKGKAYWSDDKIFCLFSGYLDDPDARVNSASLLEHNEKLQRAIQRRMDYSSFLEIARKRFVENGDNDKADRCTEEAHQKDREYVTERRVGKLRKNRPGVEKVKTVKVDKKYSVIGASRILGVSQNNVHELADCDMLDMFDADENPKVSGRSIANYLELHNGWLSPRKVAEHFNMSEATVRRNKIPLHPETAVRISFKGKYRYIIDPDKLDYYMPETVSKRTNAYSIEGAARKTGVGQYRIRQWIQEGLIRVHKDNGISVLHDRHIDAIQELALEETEHIDRLKAMLDDDILYNSSSLVRSGFPMMGLYWERVKGRMPEHEKGGIKPLFFGSDLKAYLERYRKHNYLSRLRGAADGYYTIADSSNPKRIGVSESTIRKRIAKAAKIAPEVIVRMPNGKRVYTIIPESSFRLFGGKEWNPVFEQKPEIPEKFFETMKAVTVSQIQDNESFEEIELLRSITKCSLARKGVERDKGLRLSYVRDMGHLMARGRYDSFLGWEEIPGQAAFAFFDDMGWMLEDQEALETIMLSRHSTLIEKSTDRYYQAITALRTRESIEGDVRHAFRLAARNYANESELSDFGEFANACIDEYFKHANQPNQPAHA